MAAKTKIILEQDIPNLGVAGDVREVAHGYARNYLLPRRLAVPASPRALKKGEERREKLEQERKLKLAAAQDEAKKIQETVCSITVRAGKDGKLFGSITTTDVAAALAQKGLPVDRRWIELRETIRATGEFTGAVRLHPQVRAVFKIQVNAVS